MANIHGLGDGNNNRNASRQNDYFSGENTNGMFELLGAPQSKKNPREENFWDMLHFSFCPRLKLISFTSVITLINTVCFIATLVIDGINRQGSLLEVGQKGIIMSNLAESPSKIRVNYQLWRLISSIFLHLNLNHIVMNSFSLLIWGSMIEALIGTFTMSSIYIISGICGNLLSADYSSWYGISVGASGAIFGVTGALVGVLILNWNAMSSDPKYKALRGMLVCMVAMVVIFNFMMVVSSNSSSAPGSSSDSKIDNYAHIGGFVSGISLALGLSKCMRADTPYEKKARVVGHIFSIGFVVVTSILLYLRKN